MFVLVVQLEAKPDSVKKLELLLKSMVELAAQEEGVVFYSVNRPQERQNTFLLYELYKTRSDWEAHLQLPLIKAALQEFESLLLTPPTITFCEPVFSTNVMKDCF